ncbi:hypothetical protein HPP92_000884 [Vanilla planifolia]|uniref:Uncharacterized protein n=1 Tax=Vanilla planifolia TaxID=51239 RepID=A0A835VGF0_VANPL|nr:hypothetical protein HPP92_000884 [Vanilla planifolia]
MEGLVVDPKSSPFRAFATVAFLRDDLEVTRLSWEDGFIRYIGYGYSMWV